MHFSLEGGGMKDGEVWLLLLSWPSAPGVTECVGEYVMCLLYVASIVCRRRWYFRYGKENEEEEETEARRSMCCWRNIGGL